MHLHRDSLSDENKNDRLIIKELVNLTERLL